ncbi:MAG: hypothetical protein EP330_10230 [Deltaproteobacteria bacterium]|nr:MAG: hypothetical protein EP330_10230 [Deltaproteobacteria bacterium]
MRITHLSPLFVAMAAPTAFAQSPELVSGQSSMSACLADETCAERVTGLLGETMTEYGFLLDSEPMATSALASRGNSPIFELRLDGATLGPRNELEQQVPIIPGLPRLSMGWLVGSTTYNEPTPQLAFGVTLLPSVRAGDSLFASGQFDASIAVPVAGPALWVGGGLSYGTARVELPLFGAESQLEAIEEDTGHPIARTACEEPCIDWFRQHVGTARLGFSLDPAPGFFAWGRGSAALVHHRFDVGYDDTSWRLRRLQLGANAGLGVRAGTYQLAASGTVALRPEALSTTGARTLTKVSVTMSWRLGRPRIRHEVEHDTRAPLPEP